MPIEGRVGTELYKYLEKRAIVIMLYGGKVTLLPSFQACIPLLLTDKIASAASVQDVSEDIAIREIEAMSIVLLHFLLHREGQIWVSSEFCSQCIASQTVPLPKTFTVYYWSRTFQNFLAAVMLCPPCRQTICTSSEKASIGAFVPEDGRPATPLGCERSALDMISC